jgi:2-keto-4-pentenoate hydratase/2-oxohepta-3-ene-1,7-dioic acid hydratase in catechol pathway
MMQSPPEVDYEGELAIVIGSRCRNLPEDEKVVEAHIAGFTCALDITGRRWQGKKGGNQWCIAKSVDTFCPLGPAVVPVPLRTIPQLHLTTTLNGTVVQRVQLSDMIFSVTRMVSFLSGVATLHPGTVILTGTPAGVGYARTKKCDKTGEHVPDPHYLKHGDVLEVSIDSIGTLKCDVAFE